MSRAPSSNTSSMSLAPLLVALLALAVFPLLVKGFYVELIAKIMILSVFALSLELLAGTTGLVSLGHAAYFGIAAYVAALLGQQDVTSLPLMLGASMLAAAAYALVSGALALRTSGVYFIMVTLAFGQMAYFVFHDTGVGGGSDGIYLNSKPSLSLGSLQLLDLDKPLVFYWFVLGCLVFTYAFLALLARSRFGHALAGIRVNEQRMRAVGFTPYTYKLTAFVIAGALAGLGGFLFALKDGFVNPELLSWHQSGAVLIMIILGGLGRLRGAVIGAFVFVLLQELFQSQAVFGKFAKHWQLLLGLTIIACVALMPQGIAGLPAQLAARRAARKARPDARTEAA